jgi:hypothetical protein
VTSEVGSSERRQGPHALGSAHPAGSKVLEGRPVERWGPVRLGVHPVISGGPPPAYTHRAHDHLLYAVLDPQIAANRLVVLRGGSSTGKSRAAYEAVRARLPSVPVLYPPTAAALDVLLDRGIAGRSVLWLNELRHYADDVGGQAVLAKPTGLLPGRDHLMVITSVQVQVREPPHRRGRSHRRGHGTAHGVMGARPPARPLHRCHRPFVRMAAGGGVLRTGAADPLRPRLQRRLCLGHQRPGTHRGRRLVRLARGIRPLRVLSPVPLE